MIKIKLIIKRIIWLTIKVMSFLHIKIDHLAYYVDKKNLSIWKRFLIRSLRVYNQIEDDNRNGDDNRPYPKK